MQLAKHVIYYTFKNKRKIYNTITKACTYDEALAAFNEELNSLDSFTLVKIEALKAA